MAKKPDLLDMEIFIPSRSRWQRSLTLEALKGKWERSQVFLVVPTEQVRKYRPLAAKHGVSILACAEDGIAATRRWIGEQATDRFLMLDDDLLFNRRASVNDPKLYQMNKTDMPRLLLLVSRMLDYYVHVSISPRQFNNAISTKGGDAHKYPFFTIGRPLRALAYRKANFLACEHGRVAVMEDFDVTLQLLRQGHKNCIITEFTTDQRGTQSPGGCSDYRDEELHARAVRKMAKLHDGYVQIVTKKNKTGGLRERLELRINWKKAHERSLEGLI